MALYPRQNSTFAFDAVLILCLLSAIWHYSFVMRHQTCNIRVSWCDIEVWQYDVDFPWDIPITHFHFYGYHLTCSVAIFCEVKHAWLSLYACFTFSFWHSWMGTWMINHCNLLYFCGLSSMWHSPGDRSIADWSYALMSKQMQNVRWLISTMPKLWFFHHFSDFFKLS